MLEMVIRVQGTVIFLPKFHCGFNLIEMVCCPFFIYNAMLLSANYFVVLGLV